jgi:enoyl-CoA hydratase/carnithine racemase
MNSIQELNMADGSWITRVPHENGVVELSLNSPPVNALTPEGLMEYRDVFDELSADDAVRAIVVSSPLKVLSAGLNLKVAQDFDEDEQRAIVDGLNQGFLAQYACPKPVICAASGVAIAGGLFIVLASDYRVASPNAQFGLAEVRVGVDFPVGPLEIARATLSSNDLRRMLLRGQPVTADQALAAGIVDKIVSREDVLTQALTDAAEFARLPSIAYAAIKQQLRGDTIAKIKAGTAHETGPWFNAQTRGAMQKMLG